MKVLIVLCFSVSFILGAHASDEEWWENGVFYQIYPRSFKDSGTDGVGDLKGIIEKFDYFKELGIDGVWLSPIFKSPMVDFGYDISDFKEIDPIFGTMADLRALIKKGKDIGIKIILDFVPNHTSNDHEWFKKALQNDPQYKDYYVWKDGKENGAKTPNNWQSAFHTAAWTKPEGHTQYYLHQFAKEQPDLNFRNPKVQEEMIGILKFWLDEGIDGFRIDSVNFMYEDSEFRDDNIIDSTKELIWENLDHKYTMDQPESYEIIYAWRELLESYKTKDSPTKLMMTEAYANIDQTMLWYGSKDSSKKGGHIPFNFGMIKGLFNETNAIKLESVIDDWLKNMPEYGKANWVLGNHDRSRVASRFGRDRVDSFAVLEMTLPGIAVIYYGEEIGMEDNRNIKFEETKDPQASNTNAEVYQEYTRDPFRTPFQWDETTYAGFTDSKTLKTWLPVHSNYPNVNLAKQRQDEKSLFNLYKALIEFRKHETFMRGSFESKVMSDTVFVFKRSLKGKDTYTVAINLGSEEATFNFHEFNVLKAEVVLTSLSATHKVGATVETTSVKLGRYEAVIFKTSAASTTTVSLVLLFIGTLQYLY